MKHSIGTILGDAFLIALGIAFAVWPAVLRWWCLKQPNSRDLMMATTHLWSVQLFCAVVGLVIIAVTIVQQ